MFVAGLTIVSTGMAAAAPPASCAGKFVGTWTYPGGTTVVKRDGTAIPHCPMCVPMQTWTCNGNTYLFQNPGGQSFSATLMPDGTVVGSTGIVATRVGGAPKVRAETPKVAAPKVRVSEPRVRPPTAAVSEPRVATPTVSAPAPKVRVPTSGHRTLSGD